MKAKLRVRPRLPLHETLHMAHVMSETVAGLLCGRSGGRWTRHLLQGTQANGSAVDIAFMMRLEFQDGARKAVTQSYHGSGRPHIHVVVWVDGLQKLPLPEIAAASLETEDADLEGYVRGSQCDRDCDTPWQINAGASRRSNRGDLKLHHTSEDHRHGVRAFLLDIMDTLKCHQDFQVADEHSALMSYVSKHTAKFSDSMQGELLNDDADGNSIAPSPLNRYRTYEPEMALQLFGARFRQWRISTLGGGKRSFSVPLPDATEMPEEIRMYQECAWKGAKTTLLDFLRKTTNTGEVGAWLVGAWLVKK